MPKADRNQPSYTTDPKDPLKYRSGKEKVLTPKQTRARHRAQLARGEKTDLREVEAYYGKKVEEWDLDELAHGKPRASDGTFKGAVPKWITPEIEEQAQRRFKKVLKGDAQGLTVRALAVIQQLMEDDDIDDRGRAVTPASVRLSAAQFLIEHAIGKPVQEVKGDISIQLQSVLAAVMTNPMPQGDGPQMPILDGEVIYSSTHAALDGVDEDDDPVRSE